MTVPYSCPHISFKSFSKDVWTYPYLFHLPASVTGGLLSSRTSLHKIHSIPTKQEIRGHTWRHNKTAQVLLEFSPSQPFSPLNLSFQSFLLWKKAEFPRTMSQQMQVSYFPYFKEVLKILNPPPGHQNNFLVMTLYVAFFFLKSLLPNSYFCPPTPRQMSTSPLQISLFL